MSLSDEKNAIVARLKTDIPEAIIETDLETLFTAPEGKIVVLYSGAPYNESNQIPFLSRSKIKRWTISLTVRDPLKEDIALNMLEKVRESLHGMKFGINDNERLMPDSERFEEFIEGSQVFAYKIDFVIKEIVSPGVTNID